MTVNDDVSAGEGDGIDINSGTANYTHTSGNVTTNYGGFLLTVNDSTVESEAGSAIFTTSGAGGTINIVGSVITHRRQRTRLIRR